MMERIIKSLAGFVIVSFTIRQIVKYRCDKKDKE